MWRSAQCSTNSRSLKESRRTSGFSDAQDHIDHKIGVYLACGTHVVVLVDPYARTIDAYDADGRRSFTGDDRFEHPALPGLTFTLGELFAVLARPR